MAGFMIRFLISNLFISGIIGILLTVKKILKRSLTGRMQYNLWFLLFGLLAVPFMPLQPVGFSRIFACLDMFKASCASNMGHIMGAAGARPSGTAYRINDFAVSVSREAPSIIGLILCGIWMIGILTMTIRVITSWLCLNSLKKSALPLQNWEVCILYKKCLDELNITTDIPLYSTAFLSSPVIAGLFKPCIYLPVHLISDYRAADLRYMLLHELQHYRHKDAIANYLINLFGVLYWFNPFVWYAFREMRSDREVACDTSVLNLLSENDYEDYGNTLINFAEKISLAPSPSAFESNAVGIGGNMRQMKKRIVNIASYKKPSAREKAKEFTVWAITATVLLCSAPMLSTYAADQEIYKWDTSTENIFIADLFEYFNGYEGSFVLYNAKNDTWNIYNMNHATLRMPPNSTYKIYDALFGLDAGIITPENSTMAWNETDYPFEEWNADQNLDSAMEFSVNWYFQAIDRQLGASLIKDYLLKTGYGNRNAAADLSSYWMESSLKISPVEQVQLLAKLYTGGLDFAPENVDAVRKAILLSSSADGNFYGKTGTGCINGHDVNGWFIGCMETYDNTYFFAANITATENATGSKASEISLSILSDMGIWGQ